MGKVGVGFLPPPRGRFLGQWVLAVTGSCRLWWAGWPCWVWVQNKVLGSEHLKVGAEGSGNNSSGTGSHNKLLAMSVPPACIHTLGLGRAPAAMPPTTPKKANNNGLLSHLVPPVPNLASLFSCLSPSKQMGTSFWGREWEGTMEHQLGNGLGYALPNWAG